MLSRKSSTRAWACMALSRRKGVVSLDIMRREGWGIRAFCCLFCTSFGEKLHLEGSWRRKRAFSNSTNLIAKSWWLCKRMGASPMWRWPKWWRSPPRNAVTLEKHARANIKEFRETVARRAEIVECLAITGDGDFQLRIVARDLASFSQFLMDVVIPMPGVATTRSHIVLEQVKSTTALPLATP